jgi:hypothetical protein
METIYDVTGHQSNAKRLELQGHAIYRYSLRQAHAK